MGAKGLKITDDELVPFSVENIIDNSVTDFDIFINVQDHMILYGNHGYRWMKEELEGLLKHGHHTMLTRKRDAHKVKTYSEITRLPTLDENLAPNVRLLSIEKVGAAFTAMLFESDLSKSCVAKANQIASALTNCILEDTSSIQALNHLVNHDQYVYFHSIRVATYAVAIAVEMGLTDEAKLREIALGGIFHDIGKKEVGLEIINKRGPLSNMEWKIMRGHPTFGFHAVAKSLLSHVPREIILHHHEKPDGSGYPDGLDRNSILAEVEIASLADVYDALTSARAYQQKRNTYEALDFIKHKMVTPKMLSAETYLALVKALSK